jgi:integrase
MAAIVRRISKDGNITRLVRVRRKGYPPQTATFQRLSDAKKWAHITEAAVLEGKHFPTTGAKRHTLAELIDRYSRDVLPGKSRSSQRVQVLQLRWWKANLGERLLSNVSPAIIAEHRDRLAKGDGKPRSNATVVRYLAALSHAFTIAVREWGWVNDNPVLKVSKPKEPRGRVRFLSDDERERLLDACTASKSPYLYTLVTLAISTGARIMELLSLAWRDVDFQRGVITLEQTKNGERRTLPLAGYALELMCQHAANRRTDTELLFPNENGTKPLSMRVAFDGAVRRAGIHDFTFKDLRHSAASYLAMNGATLAEIAEILGHKSYDMVKRYAHLSEQHTAKVVERMNRSIFG